MTFAIGHSGTHAGWKKPMGNAKPWTCECLDQACNPPCDNVVCLSCVETRKTNAAYLTRCPDCGTRRP